MHPGTREHGNGSREGRGKGRVNGRDKGRVMMVIRLRGGGYVYVG